LGQYQKALEFYQQSLIIAREIGDRQGELNAVNNSGLAYSSLGQYQKSLELYQQSLTIAREIGDRQGETSVLSNSGSAYSSLGQYQKSLELYQQSLIIAREIGARKSELSALGNSGNASIFLGEYQKALEFYQQTLIIAREISDREGEGLVLASIGTTLQSQKLPEPAIAFLKQSVNLTEQIRQDLGTLPKEQRQSYTDTVAYRYRTLADLLITQGRIAEAQQVLELLKLEELREFTRNARIREAPTLLTLNDYEKQMIEKMGSVTEYGRQLYECEQTQCTRLAELKKLRQDAASAYDREIASIIAIIRRNRSTDDTFYDPRYLNESAREIVEEPGSVLIYTLVLDDKLWLLWTSKGEVIGKKEVPVDQVTLGNTVLRFRELLKTPSNLQELQTTSRKLYDWLIAPIASEIPPDKAKHLIFAQDRVTRYIPMAALFDGKQYLIENYAVSTILSADLTDMSDRLAPGTANNRILGFGLTQSVAGLPALDNVENELNAIVQQNATDPAGIYPGTEIFDKDFTLDRLSTTLSGNRILHIATHGKFVPGVPESSYLVLGNGQRLNIPDINSIGSELRNINLVVLSACETALGGPGADGIEIAGISSYFLQAKRASTVLASLWLVNDPATSSLMQHFYTNLSQNKTKSQALRQAQLSLLSGQATEQGANRDATITAQPTNGSRAAASTDQSHPYYWAPFILIGNGL
jgi:CHAT domain-containing protein